MTDERHSEADEPSLIADEGERAEREAINAVRQFDRVLDMVDEIERGGRPFRLRVSMIQDLHRAALREPLRISCYAPRPVTVFPVALPSLN